MRENTLKQRLYAGKAAFGVMCAFPSPPVVGCPDALIPKFLGLGVRYVHSTVGRLLQQSSTAYLQSMREAAAKVGK